MFRPATKGTIRTSYESYKARARQGGITITESQYDLTPQCSGGSLNCELSSSIPNGLYHLEGNLTLVPPTTSHSYTFPQDKYYVIMVHGNLTITDRILVPNGSTVTFVVSGNLYVDQTVGSNPRTICTPSTVAGGVSTGCDLEGFYSVDRDFIIQGKQNACATGPDKRLNIAGSVVVNGGLSGGVFINARTLCTENLYCPTYTFTERVDLYLNTPRLNKMRSYTWEEIAP